MRFYLGTHKTHWLADPRFENVPLFISRRSLDTRVSLPRARGRWALDSGGFTEIKDHGRWTVTPEQYVERVRRYADGIGTPDFVAPMDWMCEPWVIQGGWHNGLYFHGTREARGIGPGEPDTDLDTAVRLHLRWTVDNFLELRDLAPDLPWMLVLQGLETEHYRECARMYEEAGVELAAHPIVGLGSVCRRQSTDEIGEIVSEFSGRGLRLHGFGVKIRGVAKYGDMLASSDSLAWSFDARRADPLPGHTHKSCANCPDWALRWRDKVVRRLPGQRVADTAA